MIVRAFLIHLFILNLFSSPAQNLDSLKTLAAQLLNDTDRVQLFYREGFAKRAIDPQYSYGCAIEAKRFASRANLPYYSARAFNLLGVLYYRKGDLSTALMYHKKSLKLREQIKDEKGEALSYTNLGNIYTDLGLYQLAEDAYLKALQKNQERGQDKQIDNCLLNLGVLNAELKNWDQAKNYFDLVLKNATKRFDYELEASALNNLAAIYSQQGKYDEAISSALNSIKIKNLMDNEMEMADSYLEIASAYIHKKQADLALLHLLKADSLIVKYEYEEAKNESYLVYAAFYQMLHDFKQAYFNLKIYTHTKDSIGRLAASVGNPFDFNETNPDQEISKQKQFPVFYFILLFSLFIMAVLIVYPRKR